MTEASDALQVVYDRIREQIRPNLDRRPGLDSLGYNCCGCTSNLQIVQDIEAIIRAEYRRVAQQPKTAPQDYDLEDFEGIRFVSIPRPGKYEP